jgi:hypothetical protein
MFTCAVNCSITKQTSIYKIRHTEEDILELLIDFKGLMHYNKFSKLLDY